ncbi:M18 family aminopeptidase [Dysosmobacter segnis]|uniref:M18 family aminopeptidase n=1 Tax=Dysosmobacter segnis TaxID=2763042 RepID=A0A923S676_9FIRM|nr:M18 family aminopeptidase [Dysosmobacter segnis]
MDTVQKLFRFLDESPTCYHAAANAKAALTAAGAVELRESEQWKLEKGTLYIVERGDSALVAFRVPEGPLHGFLMAASHSDSPTFKVRETAEAASAGNTLRLSVEPYGGGVWRGWLDRPLSVAGRVMIRQGDRLVSRLVNIDRDLLVIPGVAIHMDRSVNKGAELNPAVDLLPLLGCGKEPGTFRKLIAEAAGVREEHLLSTELFLYPRTKAVQTGLNGEFIVSPRLDDLQCVFGCLEGFLAAKPGGSLPVLAVFNNEEVGSNTRQGADSTFLTDVLERIAHGCGLDSEAWKAAVANSFMVSADNAHAIHPAHPEYADKGEFPVLGGGIVIKYNANQRYTTDAVSGAVFQAICQEAGVPVQRYSNRADLPGGSTLGNISTAHLSVPTVDIGLPQLAMHSVCETAGAADTDHLVKAMTAYFSRDFHRDRDGGIVF